MTTYQQLAQWESKSGAKLCSCNKGERVFYQCKERTCLNHITQPTYCIDCLNIGQHPHYPQHKIIEVIQQSDSKWSSLKERYDTVVKRAQVSYKHVETLVLYLEAEALKIPAHQLDQNSKAWRCITQDFQTLLGAFKELERHVEEVEKIKENGLIDKLASANNQYDRFD